MDEATQMIERIKTMDEKELRSAVIALIAITMEWENDNKSVVIELQKILGEG